MLGLRRSEHDRLQTTFFAELRPRADSALWYMVQGDNEQPPTADMVRSCWVYTKRSQFPNAKTIKASTLDEFGQILVRPIGFWSRSDAPVVSR